jgi:hypothetical protein
MTDREQIILEFLPIADDMAARFVLKKPSFLHIEDDIRQHVRVKLVEAVDAILEKKEFLRGKFEGFLRICVMRTLSDFARTNELIQTIPRDEFTTVEPLPRDMIDTRVGFLEETGETLLRLYSVCQDPIDCLILQMKEAGMTTGEIQVATKRTPKTIQDRLQKLRRRYERKKECDCRSD